ncbi:TPA: hypothetical protein P2R06_000721 [Aeromonas veronii]|nr:hypothetical protein [Aeromonas veronii]
MRENNYINNKDFFVFSVAVSPLLITLFILMKNLNINVGEMSNVIIAIATFFATYIHFSSAKQQRLDRIYDAEKRRKDRLWDINKNILLELSDALHTVIGAYEYTLQKHEYLSSGKGSDIRYLGQKTSPEIYVNLEDKLKYTTRVYKGIMSDELIEKCDDLINTNHQLNIETSDGDIGVNDAIDFMLLKYKNFAVELQGFITDVSGVADMKISSCIE